MSLLVNQGRLLALVFLLLFGTKSILAQTGPRGFNQLFDSVSWNSSTGVKLNPQAISFVEGYMQRYGPGLRKMKGYKDKRMLMSEWLQLIQIMTKAIYLPALMPL